MQSVGRSFRAVRRFSRTDSRRVSPFFQQRRNDKRRWRTERLTRNSIREEEEEDATAALAQQKIWGLPKATLHCEMMKFTKKLC